MTLVLRLGQRLAPLAEAYARILFCESPWVGAWFAAITWFSPGAALAGVIALVAAALWGRLLSLSDPGLSHLVNSLLVGLFIGAFHAFDLVLLGWLVTAALFTTLITHWLASLLWRWGKLPILSLPFVLVSWMVILAAQGNIPAAMLPGTLAPVTAVVFTPWLDNFFIAIGWLMLVPYPVAGMLLFAGLLVASRYLALLAVVGYVAGYATLLLFARHDGYAIGFNFLLSAMALGGIFAVPGWASFLLALAGGALAAWFVVAQGALLSIFYLPLLTLPFICTVYLFLGGLSARSTKNPPYLTLDHPTAPEISLERMRLALTRGGDPNIPALQPPFYGEWRVSQSFDGPHTHREDWRHALDFHLVEGAANSYETGGTPGEYYCFGAPVLAPTAGQIVRLRGDLPDVALGEADVTNNWGNYLLLRSPLGYYVLLAHLRQASIQVYVGQWVIAGQSLAACGSSGRSTEPHLHMHVQDDEQLGSPTRPFHLINVLVRMDDSTEYHLYHLPQQGAKVAAAPRNEYLTAALHLLPGRILTYGLRVPCASDTRSIQLRSELTLLGQSRLVVAEGISAAFVETPTVIGYYDRQGKPDALLDLWMLAVGLTPLSGAADRWGDRPALRLLPLGPLRHLLVALLRPLGAGCNSHYRRHWDEVAYAWVQEGEHCVCLVPGIKWCATTTVWIDPNQGVRCLQLNMFGKRWEAILEKCSWVGEAKT